MSKYLLLVFENDENGNKKNGVQPRYLEFNSELKLKEQYDYYRSAYQTTEALDGTVVTTGIKAYTVELSKFVYKTMTKADADAFVASIIE